MSDRHLSLAIHQQWMKSNTQESLSYGTSMAVSAYTSMESQLRKPRRWYPFSPGWPPSLANTEDGGQHDTLFSRVNSHYLTSASWKKNQEIKRDRGENKGGMANPLSQETVEKTETHRGETPRMDIFSFGLPQVCKYSFTGVKLHKYFSYYTPCAS